MTVRLLDLRPKIEIQDQKLSHKNSYNLNLMACNLITINTNLLFLL